MVTKNLQYDHIITKAEPDDANFKPHFHNVYELEYIFNIENGEFAFGHNKYAVKSDKTYRLFQRRRRCRIMRRSEINQG